MLLRISPRAHVQEFTKEVSLDLGILQSLSRLKTVHIKTWATTTLVAQLSRHARKQQTAMSRHACMHTKHAHPPHISLEAATLPPPQLWRLLGVLPA